MVVKEHVMFRSLKEVVIIPDHVNRTESEEFRKTKQRLKEDGTTNVGFADPQKTYKCIISFWNGVLLLLATLTR
jgi:hypothetical protein